MTVKHLRTRRHYTLANVAYRCTNTPVTRANSEEASRYPIDRPELVVICHEP
jgi:hypothetical protein